MFVHLFNWFVKLTGYIPQKLFFLTKIYREPPESTGRNIRGPVIIISDHTSVFDYAVYLFVFFGRTLRVQMAEVLFEKKPLGLFLKAMGGIEVKRASRDFGFMSKSEDILKKGGAVLVFPEGRIPKKGETRPLEFQAGAAYLALASGALILPVYTNGSYFHFMSFKKRARVIIGTPFTAEECTRDCADEKEAMEKLTREMRRRIIELEKSLNERTGKS